MIEFTSFQKGEPIPQLSCLDTLCEIQKIDPWDCFVCPGEVLLDQGPQGLRVSVGNDRIKLQVSGPDFFAKVYSEEAHALYVARRNEWFRWLMSDLDLTLRGLPVQLGVKTLGVLGRAVIFEPVTNHSVIKLYEAERDELSNVLENKLLKRFCSIPPSFVTFHMNALKISNRIVFADIVEDSEHHLRGLQTGKLISI